MYTCTIIENYQCVRVSRFVCPIPWCSPRLRVGLIGGLAAMESLQLRHGRYFDPSGCNEFIRAYLVYRSALNSLHEHALQVKEMRYHMRPKCHQLGHLVFHFLPKNGRYSSCYADEDFVARTKRVAIVSHPLHVSRLALLRYTIHVCMMWHDQTI